ncbi:MAG: hypothetical protein KKA65_03710 [Nanoarchaeota archaeon]|nr:hypothetical protein [Nanoarchaeota archaeon]MBU4242206.1 hypothetical protein [Nanoarchaeota archaeon]MBU4351670.1 hypothetical protein [Nanoarchaeota archaeon]MBU4456584.1 hypothetical protein [Nanoarchaeota archaeon]MCG2720128.1 hypothetical protein [Nanoarchaeota archaeon]
MQKRGQITVFIVIGILIVTLIILLVAVKDRIIVSDWDKEKEASLQVPEKAREVQRFVQGCVEQVAEEGLVIMGLQGGYINLPTSHITTPRHPFATYLEIIPNTDIKTAYWYYTTPNNLQKTALPSIRQMQDELSAYIEDNLAECTFNFTLFKDYNVTTGPIFVETEIQQDKVLFTIDYLLDIDLYDFNYKIDRFYTDINSRYGELYLIAKEIQEKSKEDFFLEEKAIDVLAMNQEIPFASTEFTCSPKLWKKSDVEKTLRNALQTNMQFIKLKGTNFAEREKYFIWDLLDKSHNDISANFHYSTNWPLTMEVYPSEGELLKAEPLDIDNEAMSYLMSLFCLRDYNFVYDVKFPVLISLTDDQGNRLQFATQVIIDNNQPRENKLGTLEIFEQEQQICENAINPVIIQALAPDANGNLNPIESVDVSMKCVSTTCDLGTTKLINREPRLQAKIPQCTNALLIGNKEGYHEARELTSTVESGTYTLLMEPYKELDYEIKIVEDGMIREVEEDETIIIQIKNDDLRFTKTLTEPSGKVQLIATDLDISTSLITQGFDVTIQGKEITHCFQQPTTNILGLLGFTEEKCTTIQSEDMELDQIVRGGSETVWYLQRPDLWGSEKVTFYIPAAQIPNNIDDLEVIYAFIENPAMAIDPKLE